MTSSEFGEQLKIEQSPNAHERAIELSLAIRKAEKDGKECSELYSEYIPLLKSMNSEELDKLVEETGANDESEEYEPATGYQFDPNRPHPLDEPVPDWQLQAWRDQGDTRHKY